MAMAEWRRFDYADKPGTAPAAGEMVWIAEEFYTPGGVTVGVFDGFTFRVLPSGSDDCSVTHWAPLGRPDPPAPDVAEPAEAVQAGLAAQQAPEGSDARRILDGLARRARQGDPDACRVIRDLAAADPGQMKGG